MEKIRLNRGENKKGGKRGKREGTSLNNAVFWLHNHYRRRNGDIKKEKNYKSANADAIW